MKYVYVIRSKTDTKQFYTGIAYNVDARLKDHNSGKSRHTVKYKPWELIVSVGFKESVKAHEFERYIKSGSGRVFSKRHFRS